MDYSAEEALGIVRARGATVLPGVKTLGDAAFGKVFSGRKADGTLWKITKTGDDRFTVDG